ncbi:hypothetical protein ACS0TY_035370 [Phlomoides rotata]
MQTLVRIQFPENLRVPPQGSSMEGESGPKIRLKGVVDRQQCRKVKEVGDLMTGEPATEAPENGGHNYNGPKVAKFLVGCGLPAPGQKDPMKLYCSLGLRHGPDSYGRQQWGIFRNGRKPDGVMPRGGRRPTGRELLFP